MPHGFRSGFRDWAAERTDTRHAVMEAGLAHVVRNMVRSLGPVRALTGLLARIAGVRRRVEGWIATLEEDPREIRRAAADAQKISDFVLVRSREREADHVVNSLVVTPVGSPEDANGPEGQTATSPVPPQP